MVKKTHNGLVPSISIKLKAYRSKLVFRFTVVGEKDGNNK